MLTRLRLNAQEIVQQVAQSARPQVLTQFSSGDYLVCMVFMFEVSVPWLLTFAKTYNQNWAVMSHLTGVLRGAVDAN